MLATSSAIDARSIASAGVRAGGHWNSRGITDHSFASTHGDRDQAGVDVQPLRERVEPRRPGRPVEERREREVRVDQRVAPEVGLVGGVGQEAGEGDETDEHEQDRAEDRREPGAAQRRAPEVGPERPRRRVHRTRSSRANQRPPAANVARGRRPAARASGAIPRAPTVAQPNHGADRAVRLEPHPHAPRRRVRRAGLDQHRAAGRDERAGAREQRLRRAADADVAVEQQRGPPRARARDVGEDGAQDRLGAAGAGEPHRDGGEVEAEPVVPGGGERREVAAGTAADVEHRRDRAARAPRGRRRRRARASARSGSFCARPSASRTRASPGSAPPATEASSRP